VAVLRCLAARHGGVDARAEAIHLRAGVVDVVLAGDLRARRLEQAAHGVAERGPARVPDVERARGVAAHELEIDALARLRIVATVGLARVDDRLRELARGRRVEADVDESGARD